jgi:hypothetical protein
MRAITTTTVAAAEIDDTGEGNAKETSHLLPQGKKNKQEHHASAYLKLTNCNGSRHVRDTLNLYNLVSTHLCLIL